MEKAAIFNEASTESNFIYTDENVIPTEEGTIRSGGFKASKIGEKSDFEKSLDLELNSEPEIIAEPITKQANISVPSSSLNQNSSTIITSMETIFPVKNTHSTGSPTKAFDSQTETDAEIYDAALKNFEEGQLIRGNIIDIDKSGIYMDINFKCEGFISNEELGMDVNKIKSEYKIGDPVSACIIKIETKEGYTLLSKKKADYEQNWLDAQNALKTKEIVTIDVINAVTGGLVVAFNQLKGFIPGSHIIKDKTQALKDLVGTKMEARFIDVDRKRKKIILSNKLANKADNVKRDDLFNEIEAGQVRKGKVTSLKSFGAFVNLGGVEGLIHISELSWDRIESPEDILKIGDIIDVFILGVDKESKKVSLGLKQLQQDPWENVDQLYQIGDIIHGKISRIASFGAFVKLEKGLEGLVHISEISPKRIEKVEDELAIGDPVKIKILRIIPDEQKIGLSIKRVNEEIIAPVSNEEKHKLPAIEKESNESSSAYTSPNSPRNKTSMADAFDKLSDAS